MAQIPVYGDRKVREAPLQGGFQQPGETGKGLAAIGQGLSAVGTAGFEINKKDQELKAADVENQLVQKYSDWVRENQSKFQGQNAAGFPDAVKAWWKQAADDSGQQLNDYGKSLIGARLQAHATSYVTSANSWTLGEQQRAQTDLFKANANNTLTTALSTGNLADGEKSIDTLVQQFGDTQGFNDAQRADLKRTYLSQMYAGAVSQLSDKDAVAAGALLEDKIKAGVIDPKDALQLRQVVKVDADKQFARQFALDNQGLSYDQQVAKAQAIQDPDRQKLALSEVDAAETRKLHMEHWAEKQAQEQAVALFTDNKDVPTSLLMKMDPLARMSLENSIAARAKNMGAPPKMSDAKLLHEALTAPPDVIRATWGPAKIAEFQTHLSSGDYGRVLSRFQDSQKPQPGLSRAEVIANAAKQAGLEVTATYSRDPAAFTKQTQMLAKFQAIADARINAAEKKGPIDSTEMAKLLEPLWMDLLHKRSTGVFSIGYEDQGTPSVLLTDEERLQSAVMLDGRPVPLGVEQGKGHWVATISETLRSLGMRWLEENGLPQTETALREHMAEIKDRVQKKRAELDKQRQQAAQTASTPNVEPL